MIETEVEAVESFVIGPSFDIPELTTIRDVDWVDRHDPTTTITTYFDTAQRLLARRGLTVHQECEGDLGTWFITSSGVARRELIGIGPANESALVAPVLAGLIGDRELQPAMTLNTLRTTAEVFDDDGQILAMIRTDRLTARLLGDSYPTRTWDELCVGFAASGRDVVADQLRRKLTDRGAIQSDGLGRVEQLLRVNQPRRPAKLAGLVHDYVIPQFDRLLLNDVALRMGLDAAHETRVSARRLLSVLKVMDEVFEPEPTRKLAAELNWFAGVLGRITDCDTRRSWFRKALSSANVAPAHLAGRKVVKRELDLDRDVALLTLHDCLASQRYAALLDLIGDWRADTPYAHKAAHKPKRTVARYLDRAEAELERRLASVHDAPTPDALHGARRAARRTRYIAELAQPALGKTARLARAHAIEIQDRLGEHRDATITAERARGLAVALDGSAGEVVAALSHQLERAVDAARVSSSGVATPRHALSSGRPLVG